jgi:HEAT repeat protein
MLRYSGHLWKIGTGWPGVCLAVILAYGAGNAVGAPYVADTVEDLRQALKTPVLDPKNRDELEFRKTEVEKRVKALRPSDLRRALNLLEWRDLDKDEGLAAVDAPIRRGVIKDFMATMARILKLSGPEYTDSRLAAINLIGEMGTSVRGDTAKSSLARDLAANLAELVQDPDPAIRRAAARALGKILPDPKVATEALGKLLASNQAEDRRAAAEGLAGMLRVLVPVLKGRGNVSGNIMLEVETPDAVQTAALVTNTVGAGLGDPDGEVQRLTLEALLQGASILVELAGDLPPADLFPPTGRKPTPEERKRIEEYHALIAKDRQTVSPLTEAMEKQAGGLAKSLDDSRPAAVRFTACQVLLQMANARERLLRRAAAIPALEKADGAGAKLAPRQDGKLILIAFEQAADAPKGPLENLITEVMPALIKRLRDPDVRVRVAALEVLISLGAKTTPALPDVLPSLQDPSLFVRWATVRLLAKIGATQHTDECIKALIPLLDDPDLDVRLATANALGGYGRAAAAARRPLSREVGIGDLQIANYVANWPPAYGTQRRQEEIGDVEMRLASIRALQAIGGTDAESVRIPVLALSNALKNRDSRVRIAAAEALGQYGPAAKSAAPALRAALNDKDFDPEKRKLVEQAVSDALLSVTLGQ